MIEILDLVNEDFKVAVTDVFKCLTKKMFIISEQWYFPAENWKLKKKEVETLELKSTYMKLKKNHWVGLTSV